MDDMAAGKKLGAPSRFLLDSRLIRVAKVADDS